MEFVEKYIKMLLTDPVKGPKLFLMQLIGMFRWIALMQGSNADLWTDSGQYGSGVKPVAEVGK